MRDTGCDELHVTAVQRGGRRGKLWRAVARVGQRQVKREGRGLAGREEGGRIGGGREYVESG